MRMPIAALFSIVATFLVLPSVGGAASPLGEIGVVGSGTYNNSPSLIIDDSFPGEMSNWQSGDKVWWNGTTPYFTIDYGSLCTIVDLRVSVDNNDNYAISSSPDGTAFAPVVTILSGWGEIGSGMDTMSSDAGDPEYLSVLDIAPFDARYVRIQSTGGDNMYSVGEFQAFGATVPEPGSLCLLLCAASGLVLRRRSRGH